MKPLVDPPRLMDSADTDPVLRQALRVISKDVPSLPALGALADGAQRAMHANAATKAAASSLGAKVVVATVVGGVIAGVYFALPSGTRPVAQQHVTVVAPRVARSSSAAGAPAPGPPVTAAESRPASPLDVAPTDTAPSRVLEASRAEQAAAPELDAPSTMGQGSTRDPVTHPGSEVSSRPVRTAPDPKAGGPTTPAAREEPRSEERKPAPRPGEVDLLEGAQQSLSGDPRHALELLAEHRRTYPRGKFAQERDVLMLEAFKRLHDTAALREGARAFLGRYPHSPYRLRVDKLLE